jgi:hypothetical protein
LLEARLATTLRRVQGDLEHLAETLPADAFKSGAAGRFREQVVRELSLHARGFSEVVGFRVLDPTGSPLYVGVGQLQSAGALDQDCVKALLAGGGAGFHFSEVSDDRSGRSTMALALPVPDAAVGMFRGWCSPCSISGPWRDG